MAAIRLATFRQESGVATTASPRYWHPVFLVLEHVPNLQPCRKCRGDYVAGVKIAWFALAVIALALLAILGRYEVVPTSLSDGGVVLKLDRWNGETRELYGFDRSDSMWSEPILSIREWLNQPTAK